MNPHDLLPIKRPIEDDVEYPPYFFYDNVVVPLVTDVLRMEIAGIPINLDNVRELENIVQDVIDNTSKTLAENTVVQDFLRSLKEYSVNEALRKTIASEKKPEEFYVEYRPTNAIHRTYVVNEYLQSIGNTNLRESWSIKELREFNKILNDKFLNAIVHKENMGWMQNIIHKAMEHLAFDKATIYNKNRLAKKQQHEAEKPLPSFNPASTKQKLQFFQYLGINSTSQTESGQDQWNRKELEKLYKLVDEMIKDKENEDDTVEHS